MIRENIKEEEERGIGGGEGVQRRERTKEILWRTEFAYCISVYVHRLMPISNPEICEDVLLHAC